MSMHCLKCQEVWDHEDYQCPACGCATVDSESAMKPTLEYRFFGKDGKKVNPLTNPPFEHEGQTVNFIYDVIRLSTGTSIFDEDRNYLNAA